MIHLFKILIRLSFILFPVIGIGQKQIAIEYGRAFFRYDHIDYGNGFREQNRSNYNFIAGFTYKNDFSKNVFWQTGIYFTMYQQYYSTKKYVSAFSEPYPILHIPFRIGISTNTWHKVRFQLSGGIIIGIMPDTYTAEYEEIFVYPVFDSMTRGVIKRDYSNNFLLFDIGGGIFYKLSENFSVSLLGSYDKGIDKITQYDIYYNNGSGRNDQQAKQWGKGDCYSVRIGVSYRLKKRSTKNTKNHKEHNRIFATEARINTEKFTINSATPWLYLN
jgi:hypothetical protein